MTHILTGLELFDATMCGEMNREITTIRCLNGPHEGLNNVLDEAIDVECVFGARYIRTDGLDEEGHSCYLYEGDWKWIRPANPKAKKKIQRKKGVLQWDVS